MVQQCDGRRAWVEGMRSVMELVLLTPALMAGRSEYLE